jgi:XTP/dITP diphosphohydrolase
MTEIQQPGTAPRRIVLASNNPGKLREIDQLLAGAGMHVEPQRAFGIDEAQETGLTFVENAILKARHATAGSGLPAIADDSGIEVDALGGAPGIYSARYAGPGADDAANNARLLEALADVPDAGRTARYQCVMVYLRRPTDPTPLICTGTWEGRILREPRGSNGFGYDPYFFLPTHGCTAAELAPDTKNALSHRGQALRALVARLTGGDD